MASQVPVIVGTTENEADAEFFIFNLPQNATADDVTALVSNVYGAAAAGVILKAYPVRQPAARLLCVGV